MSDNYNQMNQKLQFIDVSYKYTAREFNWAWLYQAQLWFLTYLHTPSLRKMCPYSESFWSVFSRIWIEYGEKLSRISQ